MSQDDLYTRAAVLSAKRCRHCHMTIPGRTTTCPHCGKLIRVSGILESALGVVASGYALYLIWPVIKAAAQVARIPHM